MGVKEIKFTTHAEEKLKRLKNLGVTKEKVLKVLTNPQKIVSGYRGRKIAQGLLTWELLLRIVYEEDDKILVITVYPCKRERYE
uniref:DUF4258 domain-containing protein n=1 Tax=Thermofilum adornatum TaxID=1365176 RepID=A0A7C1GB92_9CREN